MSSIPRFSTRYLPVCVMSTSHHHHFRYRSLLSIITYRVWCKRSKRYPIYTTSKVYLCLFYGPAWNTRAIYVAHSRLPTICRRHLLSTPRSYQGDWTSSAWSDCWQHHHATKYIFRMQEIRRGSGYLRYLGSFILELVTCAYLSSLWQYIHTPSIYYLLYIAASSELGDRERGGEGTGGKLNVTM